MVQSVFRGFLSVIGAKALSYISIILVTPILVRLLGSSGYGDYAFVLSLLSISMIVVNAGIFDGTRKYIAESRSRANWNELVFGFYLRVALLFSLVASSAYFTLATFGAPQLLFGPNFEIYFYLLSGIIIAHQGMSVVRGGLMGLGLEDRSEPLTVLKDVLFAIVGVSLAYFGLGVTGVLVGELVATVLVVIISFVILSQHLDVSTIVESVPSDFPKWELLAFNSYSVVLILLTASLYHVDILLLQPIAGSNETGYYRAALVMAEFLWFVPNALQLVFLHSSSELWSNNQTGRISALASKATRYNLSLVLLLAIGLAALAEDFVPLYFGPEFEASVLPLLLLLPGAIGFAVARPIFAVGQGKGQLRTLILATGAAALVNLFLNLLLIPVYGTAGAAIATSFGYGSMAVLHIVAARRIGFDPIDDLRPLRLLGAGLLSTPVVFGLAAVIESSILSLLAVPPIGFIVYAVVSLQLGVIPPDEVAGFAESLPTPLSESVKACIAPFR